MSQPKPSQGSAGPATSMRSVSPERFLKYHSQWAQEIATQTQMVTDLYRDPTGLPRCTIEGWPLPGVKVATFAPQAATGQRRWPPKPTQTPAAAVAVVPEKEQSHER